MKRFGLIGAALLCLTLAAPSYAVPTTESATVSSDAELEAVFEQALEDMFKPGAPDRDWQKGGADVHAAVRAKPGGALKNVLLTTDKDGEASVTIFALDAVKGSLPGSWKLLEQQGEVDRAPQDAVTSIGKLGGRFYYVGRETSKTSGTAYCSGDMIGIQLFEDQADPTEGEIDQAAVRVLFSVMAKRMSSRTLCWRYQAEGESYSVRNFLPDGRTLLVMDEFNETAVIVPAAPWPQLLKKAD